eukprot:TRINITY_DN75713_c0_g1_i1.p1 TRINITY_DN75713_c0_g1~~TRINITY_DN75713_c0_g1_i1.p1  ORF type:complete len:214 (-),score=40.60 TRINITY_DN75713_c0_g1_i1:55-624(-)
MARLARSLRQWAAMYTVSVSSLQKELDAIVRLQYLSPVNEVAGMLGVAGLNREALSSARSALLDQRAVGRRRLEELQADMEALVLDLEKLLIGLGAGPEVSCISAKAWQELSVALMRGALRTAVDALGAEARLRRSLLDALAELDPQEEDDRQRLVIAWTECPFASPEEGSVLDKLRLRCLAATETLAF